MDISQKIKDSLIRQVQRVKTAQPEKTPEQDLAEIKQKLAEVENKINELE